MTEYTATTDNLSVAEQSYLIERLAEWKPDIAESLLAEVADGRRRDVVRKAMPPHAYTPELGYFLCYWMHDGVSCLRMDSDDLHT